MAGVGVPQSRWHCLPDSVLHMIGRDFTSRCTMTLVCKGWGAARHAELSHISLRNSSHRDHASNFTHILLQLLRQEHPALHGIALEIPGWNWLASPLPVDRFQQLRTLSLLTGGCNAYHLHLAALPSSLISLEMDFLTSLFKISVFDRLFRLQHLRIVFHWGTQIMNDLCLPALKTFTIDDSNDSTQPLQLIALQLSLQQIPQLCLVDVKAVMLKSGTSHASCVPPHGAFRTFHGVVQQLLPRSRADVSSS